MINVQNPIAEINQLNELLPVSIGIKDQSSVYQYASHYYTNLLNLKHPNDIIGMTDADLPCEDIAANATVFQKQDREILHNDSVIQNLYLIQFPYSTPKLFFSTKKLFLKITLQISAYWVLELKLLLKSLLKH